MANNRLRWILALGEARRGSIFPAICDRGATTPGAKSRARCCLPFMRWVCSVETITGRCNLRFVPEGHPTIAQRFRACCPNAVRLILEKTDRRRFNMTHFDFSGECFDGVRRLRFSRFEPTTGLGNTPFNAGARCNNDQVPKGRQKTSDFPLRSFTSSTSYRNDFYKARWVLSS